MELAHRALVLLRMARGRGVWAVRLTDGSHTGIIRQNGGVAMCRLDYCTVGNNNEHQITK
ncbi:MAG TPA: hypothetical protein VKA97_12075 [Pyrinomonadaceae bacterium]|nr:hypothetical protein [Pyrinomonadaceae bacterium]